MNRLSPDCLHPMKSKQDLSSHLQTEYQDRDRRLAGSDLYSWFNHCQPVFPAAAARGTSYATLKRLGINDLSDLRILEVGCGRGGVLQEFTCMGARPENMFGIDLLADRLVDAKQSLAGIHFQLADGSQPALPGTRLRPGDAIYGDLFGPGHGAAAERCAPRCCGL